MADPRGCTLVFLAVLDGSTSGGQHERVAQVMYAASMREGVEALILSAPPDSRRDIRKMVEVERTRPVQVVAVICAAGKNPQKWDIVPVSGRMIREWIEVADLCLILGDACIDDNRPEGIQREVDDMITTALARVV